MIILHPRLQYAYWFVAFVICGFLIKVCHAVFQGTAATTSAVFLTLCCVSAMATYIDKNNRICWGSRSNWNIKRLPSGQWECLGCGETSVHEKIYICGGCNDTLSSPVGCGSDVYQCHTDKAKHRQVKYCSACKVEYRECIGGHDDCGCNDDSCSS